MWKLAVRPWFSRLVIAWNAEVGAGVVTLIIGGTAAAVFRSLRVRRLAYRTAITIGRRRLRFGFGALQERIALQLIFHIRHEVEI